MFSVQHTMYNVQYTGTAQHTMFSVQHTMYNVQYTCTTYDQNYMGAILSTVINSMSAQ